MPAAPSHHAPSARVPLLALVNVSKTFGGARALQSVDFEVDPGEVICLAGENGSGKSTLIKLVTGVHFPDPGAEMRFDGRSIADLSPARARALGIQVIWQDLALFPEMSVAENIAFERNLARGPHLVHYASMNRIAGDMLARLGVDVPLEVPVRALSIAKRQMVAICRALVAKARLVFMDEPTASLSKAETEALIAIVHRLSADGIAVVFVSHRLAEVLRISHRVTVLRDGKLVGNFPSAGMTQTRLTELMTGRSFDQSVRRLDHRGASTVLSVSGLSLRGHFEDVSLTICSGEILGLTGRLGAGRTELALTLFGMLRADRGSVAVDGKILDAASPRKAIGAGLAYVSEDRQSLGLVQDQTIEDNTILTVLDHLCDPGPLLSLRKKRMFARNWIDQLKVRIGAPSDAVSTLSGGNQQRIVLAKWLATNPRVLILDAPTVGIDVGARAGIFKIISDLAAKGMAILLISDEIPEVYFNADRVLHMRGGRIVESFTPSEVAMDVIEAAVHA